MVFGAGLLVAATPASATICDLQTVSSCTVNGGIYQVGFLQPAGTGFIDSFVRIQQNQFEQGYNTDARPVQFNEKTDPNFTRDLLLSEVSTKTINGILYREFFLDVNEPNGGKNLITLDQLEIFKSNSGDLNSYSNGGIANSGTTGALAGATKVYDLDNGGDNYVQIDYSIGSKGSGSSDMAFYVKDSLFAGATNVYLFSQFGDLAKANGNDKYESQAGFEEWFSGKSLPSPPISAVPEPSSLILLGTGLAAAWRKRRALLA